jgi:hypothetical protein
MFQFTTTTIVNSLKDYNFPNNDLITEVKDGSTVVGIHIKRDFKFLKDNVEAIYKREASDPVLGQLTINLGGVTAPTDEDRVFRVALYIKLSGSQNSYYANNLLFKGKPFYIEFLWKVGETAAQAAAKVVKNAKKYQQMVYENALLNITNSGATVTIDATDEYQVFSKAELQGWDQSLGLWQEGSPVGAFATLDTIDAENDNYTGTIITLVKQGKEGFGTYRNMIKDYRLPTAANTRWNKIIQDETPVVGAKYNQYTIEYCVNRGLMGGAAVGQQVKSKTTHVFFVNQAIASDFETELAKLGTLTTIA